MSFRLDQGDRAALARVSPKRSQSRKHQRTYWVHHRTATIHNIGEVAVLFSTKKAPAASGGVTVQKVLISNATSATMEQLLTWFALRWQIELLFKLWKSHNRLAKHRAGAQALEVLAVFYAKLLGVVLQHWILVATAWQWAGRSLAKAARALVEAVKEILLALGDRAALGAALLRLRAVIEKLGGTTDRKRDPSHAQLIADPELLDWLSP